MDNTYFILSNGEKRIKRLHICTWDLIGSNAAIEIGIEFAHCSTEEIEFKLALPFLRDGDKVTCLLDSLIRDDDNCKFIFNDTIKTTAQINGDKRNGVILDFASRSLLAILPIKDIIVKNGICSFKVQDFNQDISKYVRLYIQTNLSNLAVIRKGIAKTTYIYDIKVNEKRNLPTSINDLLNQKYILCSSIEKCFCFHVIPSQYNISYLNSNKLKNIRILESNAYRYLPNIKQMKNNEYLIVFNKSENLKGTYTFFSEFEKETIGNRQIMTAVVANMVCSLLFAIPSLRNWERGSTLYQWLPFEYWLVFVILIYFIVKSVVPWKTWWHKLCNVFSK